MVGRGGHEGSRELPLLAEHGAQVLVIDTKDDAFLENQFVLRGTAVIHLEQRESLGKAVAIVLEGYHEADVMKQPGKEGLVT